MDDQTNAQDNATVHGKATDPWVILPLGTCGAPTLPQEMQDMVIEGNADDIVFDAERRQPGLVEGRQQITRRRGGRPSRPDSRLVKPGRCDVHKRDAGVYPTGRGCGPGGGGPIAGLKDLIATDINQFAVEHKDAAYRGSGDVAKVGNGVVADYQVLNVGNADRAIAEQRRGRDSILQ